MSGHDHNYLSTKGKGEPGRDPLAGLKEVFGPESPDTPAPRRLDAAVLKRCIHEAVDISQDGERTIYCANCGWELGHIIDTTDGQGFLAHSTAEHPALVVAYDGEMPGEIGVTLRPRDEGVCTVYPCATCAWRFDCEEGCHT